MHTQDAAARGIENGKLVEAYNEQSAVVFEAVVTDQIAQGNVVSEGVFRRDDCVGGKAFNALTSERLSDMGAGTTMNDNRVNVRLYPEQRTAEQGTVLCGTGNTLFDSQELPLAFEFKYPDGQTDEEKKKNRNRKSSRL